MNPARCTGHITKQYAMTLQSTVTLAIQEVTKPTGICTIAITPPSTLEEVAYGTDEQTDRGPCADGYHVGLTTNYSNPLSFQQSNYCFYVIPENKIDLVLIHLIKFQSSNLNN
jgi:hypothetical protein